MNEHIKFYHHDKEIKDAEQQREILFKDSWRVKGCYNNEKFWRDFCDTVRSFDYHPFFYTKGKNFIKYDCRNGHLKKVCPVQFLTNEDIDSLLYLTIIEGE